MSQQIATQMMPRDRQQTWKLFQSHLNRVERGRLNREEKVDDTMTIEENRARYRQRAQAKAREQAAEFRNAEHRRLYRARIKSTSSRDIGEWRYAHEAPKIKQERVESLRVSEDRMKIEHHSVVKHTLEEIPLGVTVNGLIEALNKVRGNSEGTGMKLRLVHSHLKDTLTLEFEAVS